MRREEKYPETRTFIYSNVNPHKRLTCDCVARALTAALDIPYEHVLVELLRIQLKTGYEMTSDKAIELYLTEKGWVKHPQPRNDDNTKYTGEDFCDRLSIIYKNAEIGNAFCSIGGHHVVAIKPTNHGDGFNCRYKVHDTWDCTYKCVGNYWTEGKKWLSISTEQN